MSHFLDQQPTPPFIQESKMICQLCFGEATLILAERTPSGEFRECHYCERCRDAKYAALELDPINTLVKSKTRYPPFFGVSNQVVGIVLGCWILVDVVVALLISDGYRRGTTDPLREFRAEHILVLYNVGLASIVLMFALLARLSLMQWNRRTGGLVPVARQPLPPRFWRRLVPLMIVIAIPALLIDKLGRWVEAHSSTLPWLFSYLDRKNLTFGLLVFIILLALQHPARKQMIRSDWRTASRLERFFKVAVLAWVFGFLAVFCFTWQPKPTLWGFKPWFAFPPSLAILFVGIFGMFALQAAMIRGIRPR